MIALNPQYIKDTAGQKLVILSVKEYDFIMEELEGIEDVKRYDAAKKKKQVFTDADIAFQQIDAKRMKHV